MTTLTGSEKQIKWANDIRAKVQDDFDNFKTALKDNPAAIKGIEFIENIESSRFWIDHKDFDAQGLLVLFSGELGLDFRGIEYADNARITLDGEIIISKKTR
jgi:hypothetical protein